MKLGIGSYAYVWAAGVPGYPPPAAPLTPFDLIERAVALGVRVVQIADNLPLDRCSGAELDELGRRARAAGVELETGTVGLGTAHLRRHIELAARLGARLLRTVTDTASHRPSGPEALALLRAVEPFLREHGVTLALENHDRLPAAVLRELVDAVGSPRVGICLDPANSLGCSEGPEHVLATLGPRAVCLHAKDYTVRRLPHRLGFLVEGCAAGRGCLDLGGWMARLRGLGRELNVIVELWPAPEPTAAATEAKEARWVEESVSHLRQFLRD